MWLTILLVGAASYLLRAAPMVAGRRLELSKRAQEALGNAASGAMAALLVMSVAHMGDGARPGAVVAAVLAVAVALVLGRRGRPLPLIVVVGLGVYAAGLLIVP